MSQTIREILARYDAEAPLADAFTIPAPWYTDDRIADLERRAVFGASWMVAGRVDQVATPGSYLTTVIAGEPIVVVRGADGVLRAFFNVCRHHAAAVMTEPCGHASVLRCPYHGWTYGLDGALRGVPEMAGMRGFDTSQNGLVPARVDTWEHFVFVTLDPAAPPLSDFLGGLVSSVAPLALSGLRFFERRTWTLECNWKVFVDNYLDGGYHVPHLHKGLFGVLDYARYTIETQDRFCLQSSPMVTGDDEATNVVRKGDRARYYWLYPNFMLNAYEGYLDTNLVVPRGTSRCEVVFDFYFADVGEQARARNRESVDVGGRVQDEDIAICESVQRGLSSRAYGAGRLSVRREAGEHLFHRLLAADLDAGARHLPVAGA